MRAQARIILNIARHESLIYKYSIVNTCNDNVTIVHALHLLGKL